MRNAQKIAVGKTLKGRDLVEDRGQGVGVKTQWNSAELGEDLEWLCLLQDGTQWPTLVNAVINLRFS